MQAISRFFHLTFKIKLTFIDMTKPLYIMIFKKLENIHFKLKKYFYFYLNYAYILNSF